MKKVLSLVLAIVLVIGMGAVAFGAMTNDDLVKAIKNNPKGLQLDKIDTLGSSGMGLVPSVNTSGYLGEVNPEAVVRYVITFVENGVRYGVPKDVLRRADVDVQVRHTQGGSIIDKAEIKTFNYRPAGTTTEAQDSYVEVKFVKEFISTKTQDFEATVYLTQKKSRIDTDKAKVTISGEFKNLETTVGENDDYVYLGDNTNVVKAEDYIRKIEVDLGQGVSIHTRMFADKKYYGSVSQEVKAEDEVVLAKYPDIETVYYLKTIGLSSTGDVVEFDLDDNDYVYVQDENGNLVYIGRTKDRLPYYTKYFLSSKELEVTSVIDPNEPEGPGTTPPGMGGDEAPVNVNDNPSTGR